MCELCEKYKEFTTPIVIESDDQYNGSLQNTFTSFLEALYLCEIDKDTVEGLKAYADKILAAIYSYYQGDLVESQSIINELINEFDDSAPCIISINDGVAIPCACDSVNPEVQFFRARLSDQITDFNAEDMLHIPFNKRKLVKSERFSIPGFPCLYLANTSYACWIEMGRPAEHRFNVSPVVLDNSQRLLNLTVTIRHICDLLKCCNYNMALCEDYHSQITNLLKLFMLTLGTSYRVSEPNRNFKSEYILSQMIMIACNHRGLDGVVYYSKQVDDDLFAGVSCINVALFATYNGEEKLSSICDHIKIGKSFNYSMFKQLLPCQLKEYDLSVLSSPYINNIGAFDRRIPYQETHFFEFDKYLFANWLER